MSSLLLTEDVANGSAGMQRLHTAGSRYLHFARSYVDGLSYEY